MKFLVGFSLCAAGGVMLDTKPFTAIMLSLAGFAILFMREIE